MSPSLEKKLLELTWYLVQIKRKHRTEDPTGYHYMIEDPEVQEWLDKNFKSGDIPNTHFTGSGSR